MAECLQSLAVKGNVHRFLEAVSRRKNGLPAASDTPLTDDIYYRYTEQMQAYGLADYDDLLLLTLQGFTGAHKRDKAALRMLHHLLVDEFQDINDLQYRLIQAWGEKSASLFVKMCIRDRGCVVRYPVLKSTKFSSASPDRYALRLRWQMPRMRASVIGR